MVPKAKKKTKEELSAEARKAHLSMFPPGSVTIVYKTREEIERGG